MAVRLESSFDKVVRMDTYEANKEHGEALDGSAPHEGPATTERVGEKEDKD